MRKIKGIKIVAAGFVVAVVLAVLIFVCMTKYESAGDEKVMGNVGDVSPSGRQIILSVGETPDTISVSWTGTKREPRFFRISQSKHSLPKAPAIKADSGRLLSSSYYRYSVELKGLDEGETYYYEIGDGVMFDMPRKFTAPEITGSNTFLFLGDVQFDASMHEYEEWGKITRDIYERHPDLRCAMIGGDMVNVPGDVREWDGFLENCGTFSNLPLMTAAGNHEGVRSNRTYNKVFAMPENSPDIEGLEEDFYYFDYGSCRFIVTDSSFLTNERVGKLGVREWARYEEAIEEWLAETLEKSPKAWNIVVTHHPPYGMHDRETVSPQLRSLWVPVMEENNVDLVLCGHQHMYMRTEKINGITYIMGNSGQRKSEVYKGDNTPEYCLSAYADGMNYQIIEADRRKLQIMSYNEKGLIIDETTLKKNLGFHILEFFGCN